MLTSKRNHTMVNLCQFPQKSWKISRSSDKIQKLHQQSGKRIRLSLYFRSMILKRRESRKISSKSSCRDQTQMSASQEKYPMSKLTKQTKFLINGIKTPTEFLPGRNLERVPTNGSGDKLILKQCKRLQMTFLRNLTNLKCKVKTKNQKRWQQRHSACKGP